MTITDDMIWKVKLALNNRYAEDGDIRAALEAVAPMLMFQGLMQAVQIASEGRDSGHTIDYIIALFLKRAQELDPK